VDAAIVGLPNHTTQVTESIIAGEAMPIKWWYSLVFIATGELTIFKTII